MTGVQTCALPIFNINSAVNSATKGKAPIVYKRIIRLYKLRERLKEQLLQSQEHQAKYYNQRHIPKLFKRRALVKLSTRNLRLKDKKLQPKWIGLLRVLERIGAQAYRLALPKKYNRLHDVFPIQAIDELWVLGGRLGDLRSRDQEKLK